MARDPEEFRMPIGEHLEELRRRVIHGLVGVAVACIVTFIFTWPLVAWLCVPLNRAQIRFGLPPQTITTTPTGGFAVYMKVGLISGLILAMPWIVFQLWRFIETGLYQHERKAVLALVPFSGLMAALGVAFAYYILLPLSLTFLIGFSTASPAPTAGEEGFIDRLNDVVQVFTGAEAPEDEPQDAATETTDGEPATTETEPAAAPAPVTVPLLREDPADPPVGATWVKMPEGHLKVRLGSRVLVYAPMTGSLLTPLIDVNEYLSFVLMVILAVVIGFQLPLVMLLAGASGLIDPAVPRKYRPHSIFACFVVGAFLTPADPVSMLALSLPLWGLFELGLVLMAWAVRKREAAEP